MIQKSYKKINHIKSESKNSIPIYQLREPYDEEMKRIRFNEFSKGAVEFAYKLECLDPSEKISQNLKTKNHVIITTDKTKFYTRYKIKKDSPSIGIILTNIDLNRININEKGSPYFYQMDLERKSLAMAQRALFFDQNQNRKIHKIINMLEKEKSRFPKRHNKGSKCVEKALGLESLKSDAIYTPALSEIGYKKISSEKLLSRRRILESGLFNIVGKYPRKILGLGAMPPVTGWRDTLVMASLGHMVCFVPRSSIYATDFNKRLQLAISAKEIITNLNIPKIWKKRAERNIGAAIGAENPKQELENVKKLYKYAGVKLFRIYTIGSDIRVIKTAELIRQKFGNKIEIFVGQIADKTQAEILISNNIKVDALIYGHGGGQQCTSAINGMAISTLEDIYRVVTDPNFNKTSILVEGGIGRSIGTALILGIDCCLGNQKFVHGTIETGNLFVQDKDGRICQPYPGTASPVTQIIESEDPVLQLRRTDSAGRTYYSEGKPGLMFYEEKAGSMAFWINEYLGHASRTLADLGVNNIQELRKFLKKENHEYLRIMSEKTQYLSEAHWNFGL